MNGIRKRLPAPAATILLFAADGWGLKNGMQSPAGRPRTPERCYWVPMFRQLAESQEGLIEIREWAAAGMRGWNCPAVYLECLDAAFHDIGLRSRMIAALHQFADTAREKFPMPEPIPIVPPVTRPHAAKAGPPAQRQPQRHTVNRPRGSEP